MRSVTTAETTLLTARKRSIYVKVGIDITKTGTWVYLNDLYDRDWVKSITYEDKDDSPGMVLSAVFARRNHYLNLSPLMDSSVLNENGTIFTLTLPIKLWTSVQPLNKKPTVAGDWKEVFDGVITAVDFPGPNISITALDKIYYSKTYQIRTMQKYPKDPNYALEVQEVMQEILTDTTGETLYSPNGSAITPWNSSDSPGLLVGGYIQDKKTVLQALNELSVKSFGWHCRYRWQETTGSFELQLYDPGRQLSAIGQLEVWNTISDGAWSITIDGTTLTRGTDWTQSTSPWTDLQRLRDAINNHGTLGSDVIAWVDDPVPSMGTITFTGQPSNLESVTIGGVTFTFKSSPSAATDIQIGSTLEDTIDNAVNTIARRQPITTTSDSVAWKIGTDKIRIRVNYPVDSNTVDPNGSYFTLNQGGSYANWDIDGSGYCNGSQEFVGPTLNVQWITLGTVGNSKTFTTTLLTTGSARARITGSGTLGGSGAAQIGRAATVDYTFSAHDYHKITACGLNVENIRTIGEISFGRTPNDRTVIYGENAVAKALYGDIYFGMAEPSSGIQSYSEAKRVLDNALEDLGTPDLTKTVELEYFWPAQVGDYYKFEANNDHYDTDQELAVIGFTHNLAEGAGKTTLHCRGKPAGGVKRWLRLETRGGLMPNRDYQHDGPRNLVVTPGPGTYTLQMDDPRAMDPPIKEADWAYTEIHLDTSSANFTPSASTLAMRGKQTRFDLVGLVPGQTYYGKARVITRMNTIGHTSSFVFEATEKVAPYHINGDYEPGNLTPNADFGATTKDSTIYAPDFWTAETTWADTFEIITSATYTGKNAIRFIPTGAPTSNLGLVSNYIPVNPVETYAFKIRCRATGTYSGTAGNGASFDIEMYQYDQAKNLLGTNLFFDGSVNNIDVETLSSAPTSGAWVEKVQRGIQPGVIYSGTRFVKLRGRLLSFSEEMGGTTFDLDYLGLEKIEPGSKAVGPSSTTGTALTAGSWTKINWNSVATTNGGYDYGANFNITTDQYTVRKEGVYLFSAMVRIDGNSWSGNALIKLGLYNSTTTTRYQSTTFQGSNNTVYNQEINGSWTVQANRGDVLELQIISNVNVSIMYADVTPGGSSGDARDNYFSIQRLY